MSNVEAGYGLSRAWDSYDAYLFDIDGTLLNCADATHYFAFCDSLSAIGGKPINLDGVVAHGNTDVGILRDAFALAGVSEERWRPRLQQMRDRMGQFVLSNSEKVCATPLPGVVPVLEHLRSRGAAVGVATGNLEAIGRIKLERSGLLRYFHFGGYSDSFEYRQDVFLAAVQRAREIAGQTASVCVFGDTPADVRAARANQLEVIAVSTGIYRIDQLVAEHPQLCVPSMEALITSGDTRLAQ